MRDADEPCTKRTSGYGPPGASGASRTVVSPAGTPAAGVGYHTSVTRVRLGSAGAVPFAGVDRAMSTHVRVVTPTGTPTPASPPSAASVGAALAFEQPASAASRRGSRAWRPRARMAAV